MDDLATSRSQGIALQGQGLIIGRDAGIADVGHGWNHARSVLRDPALFGSRAYGRGLTRAKGVLFARSALSSGLVLVTVAMMKVGIVRMLVPHRLVPVPMRMRFTGRIVRPVLMMMVIVVAMPVLVFHGLVAVLMIMPFGQMQPKAISIPATA